VAFTVALMGSIGFAAPASAQDTGEASAVSPTYSGQYIADFAMGYLGAPYVWAGEGPWAFDCSGFTQYVIANTVGIDIGHGTAGQTAYGAWVDWGTWAPGDLVFFANTWGPGISHVGIYIGDGQFIHAENESTGVTISSVYSDYYSGHYYGAFRIG
jgi:cell wall-associated NlpC family hydrolase